MMLNFLAFISMSQANEVLAQLENYLKNAKNLSVNLKAYFAGENAEGLGSYVFQRPRRQGFRMKAGVTNYVWTQTENLVLEIEHSQKMYREYDSPNVFDFPEANLSEVPDFTFPMALMKGTLKAIVPRNTSFTIKQAPADAEPGSTCLFASYLTGSSVVEITAVVAKDGRLLSLFRTPKGAADTLGVEVKYSNYVLNGTPPKDAFSTKLPLGYMPQVLKAPSDPYNVGMIAPLSGLAPISGGKADLLESLGHKSALLVVADPDIESSVNLLKALPVFASKLKAKGAGIAIIWNIKRRSKDAPKGMPEFYDLKGEALDRFHAPGTPFMMLIDGKGKIAEVWVGFDPQISDRYAKEAVKALEEMSANGG